MPSLPPLTLILASTPSLGIGFRGSLPWPLLKRELAFFARVTKRAAPLSAPPPQSSASTPQSSITPQPSSISQPPSSSPQPVPKTTNAVLMGRKTWSSLPPSNRPLRGRINIVITRDPTSLLASLPSPPSNATAAPIIVAPSIEAGLLELQSTLGSALGRVFVIGGAEIYALALGLEACERVLWTRLEGEWECDVWFPGGGLGGGEEDGKGRVGNWDGRGLDRDGRRWAKRGDEMLERWCGEEGLAGRKEEGGVGWRVELWEKERERERGIPRVG